VARELLFSLTKKDFDIQWFSGTGAGGQHRNKHQNCCRMTHIASGAKATGQSNKDRLANQREAFRSIQENSKFKMWFNQKVMESLSNETIEDRVKKQMNPDNIKVEEKDDRGRWKPYDTRPVK